MAHGSDVVYTLLPNQLQFVLQWYTGTLSHNSDLVYPLLALVRKHLYHGGTLVECPTTFILWTLSFPIIFNLYRSGTLVHCHTTLILCTLCWLRSSSIHIAVVHWYTVTQLWSVHPLLAPIKFNLYCGGTLVHCHTTLISCTFCWLQSISIYIAVVHWNTVTQLCSCVTHAGSNQDIFIVRWYTGTLSHKSALVLLLLASINVNLYCSGTLVHCNTTLLLCNICWLQSGYIYTAMVHWYTATQLCYCAPSAGYNQYQFKLLLYTGTLVHCHTTLLLCTLCWLQSSSIYIAVVHWCTVTQLWSCGHSAS
jgi:hypothetical protein